MADWKLEVNTFCLLKLTVWGSTRKKSSKKNPNYGETSWLSYPFFVCKTIFFGDPKSWDVFKARTVSNPQPVRSLLGRLGGIETRWMGLGFSEVEFCLEVVG